MGVKFIVFVFENFSYENLYTVSLSKLRGQVNNSKVSNNFGLNKKINVVCTNTFISVITLLEIN